MGRISTYTPSRAKEVKATVINMFGEGRGLAHVARELGVSRQTLYNWADNDPSLFDTLEHGRDLSLAWWEEKATTAAIEGTGNAPLFKFLMTNMHRRDYKERHDHTAGS